jgi:hypothetical protein
MFHSRLYKLTSFIDPEKAFGQICLLPRILGTLSLDHKCFVSPGLVIYSIVVCSISVLISFYFGQFPKFDTNYILHLFLHTGYITMGISLALISLTSWRNRFSFKEMIFRLRQIDTLIGQDAPVFDNLRLFSKMAIVMSAVGFSYIWAISVLRSATSHNFKIMMVFFYHSFFAYEAAILQQSALLSYSSQRFDLINSQLSSGDHDRILLLVRIHTRLYSLCKLVEDSFSVPILCIIVSNFSLILGDIYYIVGLFPAQSNPINYTSGMILYIGNVIFIIFLYIRQEWNIAANCSYTANKVILLYSVFVLFLFYCCCLNVNICVC